MLSRRFNLLLRSSSSHRKILFVFIFLFLLRSPSRYFIENEENVGYNQPLSKATTLSEPRQPLPKPVLVVGMPKTGTSTVHAFFNKSGYRSSHFKCGKYFCGLCFKVAVKNSKPPLRSCGDFEVYAQMDIENWNQCHFPQITNLDQLHEEAPNATFVLTKRNMTHWVTSVQNWGGGGRTMAQRLAKCKAGPKSSSSTDLVEWHEAHMERIRAFVTEHPTHTLVEIDIEDPKTGSKMAHLFGSNPKNWGHENDSLLTNVSSTSSRAGWCHSDLRCTTGGHRIVWYGDTIGTSMILTVSVLPWW